MSNDIVLLHVPKTGGTALRHAFQQALPDSVHLFDYGGQQPLTSQIIRDLRYSGTPLLGQLRSRLPADMPIFLTGHIMAEDYRVVFPPASFVAFLREPVARVVSDYKHYVRHSNYRNSLLEFASTPAQRNKQTRHLEGLELSGMGFVGIQECFDEDVAHLSGLIGATLRPARANVAPREQQVALDEGTAGQIAELNRLDIELYERALAMRAARRRARPEVFLSRFPRWLRNLALR